MAGACKGDMTGKQPLGNLLFFFFYKDSDAIFTDAHLVSADVCFCRQACTKEKMIKSANFLYETWTVTKIYQLIC